MSNQKAILVLSILLLVACFIGNGPWIVGGFMHDDWITINHFIVSLLMLTIFVGTILIKMPIGVAVAVFSVALVLACIDIALEHFWSGFVPNPIKVIRGEMLDYYKIVPSDNTSRTLMPTYIIVSGLACMLVLLKRSRKA